MIFIIRFYVNPHLSTFFIDFFQSFIATFPFFCLKFECPVPSQKIHISYGSKYIDWNFLFFSMDAFLLSSSFFFIFIKVTCQERFSILKKEDNILLCRLFSSNTISAIFQMLQFHNTINIIFCVEGEMMIFFLYLKLKSIFNNLQKTITRKHVFYKWIECIVLRHTFFSFTNVHHVSAMFYMVKKY